MSAKLSWRLIVQILSLLTLATSIVWLILEPKFEALSAFLTGIMTLIASFAASDTPIMQSLGLPAAKTNRRKMLEKIKSIWIDGVLDNIFQGIEPFQLHVKYDPDTVPQNWGLSYPIQQKHISLPIESPLKIFQQSGRELLLLGAPGAGKTTFVLQLLRDLLAQAFADDSQPIPILLHLSSWARERGSFRKWIVEELSEKYLVPSKISQIWVDNNALLFLLDGLDEINAQFRADCVDAINAFMKEQMIDIVVCSRTAEYKSVNPRLGIRTAIELQPLDSRQVDAFLAALGDQFSPLRKALGEDADLRELISTPLMLKFAMSANDNMASLPPEQIGTKRDQTVNLYIEEMLGRKRTHPKISVQQVRQFVIWLANRLIAHDQSIFLVEQLQPDWLKTPSERRVYYFVTLCVAGWIGIVAGLVSNVIPSFDDWKHWITDAPAFIAISGATSLALTAFSIKKKIVPVEKLVWSFRWSWKAAGKGLMTGMILGLFACMGLNSILCIFSQVFSWAIERAVMTIMSTLLGGLILMILASVVLGLIGALTGKSSYRWILLGLLFGGLGGVVLYQYKAFTLFYLARYLIPEWNVDETAWFALTPIASVLIGFINGSAYGLVGGVVGPIITGFQGSELEVKTMPNQGIRYSIRNAIIVGLCIMFSVALIGLALSYPLFSAFVATDSSPITSDALGFGMLFGLVGALQFGGYAAIKNFALRITIENSEKFPSKIMQLLENSVELGILSRVGGGYMFTHRLILEHLADSAE